MTISGTADVNLTGSGYARGLHIYAGATLKVVGSQATIDINEELWVGGEFNTDPNTVLSFEADANGVSTIRCMDLGVATDSILEFSSCEGIIEE